MELNSLLLYVFKVNISFSLLYLGYGLWFRNLTFHRLNRFYILGAMLFSFILPHFSFIHPSIQHFQSSPLWQFAADEVTFSSLETPIHLANSGSSFSMLVSVMVTYISITIFLLLRLLFGLNHVIRLSRRMDDLGKHNMKSGKGSAMNRYAPFSFFNKIHIPIEFVGTPYEKVILRHEEVHKNQGHTFDLILAELYCILFWFNPLVFHSRKSLTSTHEYLADKEASKLCASLEEYLRLLLTVKEATITGRFSHSFNSSIIKKRIDMITKQKSSKKSNILYLLLVPVLVLATVFAVNLDLTAQDSTKSAGTTSNVPDGLPISKGEITSTSGWGKRMNPINKKQQMHNGYDFAAKQGTQILATAPGKVYRVEYLPKSYGRIIVLDHGNGYQSFYAQMSKQLVEVGDKVNKGDIIGEVGSSGRSTGPHLHYEVRLNGTPVNPSDYFEL